MGKGISTAIVAIIAVIMVVAIAISLQPLPTKTSQPVSVIEPLSKVPPSSAPQLGNLCSGEKECKEFCQNNRALCENYCRGNENELCQRIFPPGENKEENRQPIKEEGITIVKKENCTDFHFTHYLVEPNLVKVVTPIGMVGGANTEIVGRSYIFIKDEISGKVPLYAPKDMVLRAGSYYGPENLSPDQLYDYALTFDAGCVYSIDLSHVKEVTEHIKERLPPLSKSSARQQTEPLEIKAGELIGYYIPNAGVAGFDFIVDNKKIVNKFANQERYEASHGSNLLHSVCPYDLYQGEMRQAYSNLIGGSGGAVVSGTDCGTVSRDVIGTISGQWFLDTDPQSGMGENMKEGDYGNPLPIVKGPDRITIGHIGPSNTVWIYSDNPTYKDPAAITGEHCYQNYPNPSTLQGYVYFKVASNTSMKVFYSESGTCPSSFPEEGSKTYYR